jgi:hypothetical protein
VRIRATVHVEHPFATKSDQHAARSLCRTAWSSAARRLTLRDSTTLPTDRQTGCAAELSTADSIPCMPAYVLRVGVVVGIMPTRLGLLGASRSADTFGGSSPPLALHSALTHSVQNSYTAECTLSRRHCGLIQATPRHTTPRHAAPSPAERSTSRAAPRRAAPSSGKAHAAALQRHHRFAVGRR